MENPRVAVTAISDADLDVVRAVGLGRAEGWPAAKCCSPATTSSTRPCDRTRPVAPAAHRPDSTVLVTGGFGGIGLGTSRPCGAATRPTPLSSAGVASPTSPRATTSTTTPGPPACGPSNEGCGCASSAAISRRSRPGRRRGRRTARGTVSPARCRPLRGVPDDRMLFRKRPPTWSGSPGRRRWPAIALLRELDGVDFFLAASTMTTITGGAGAFGYTVANAYLGAWPGPARASARCAGRGGRDRHGARLRRRRRPPTTHS